MGRERNGWSKARRLENRNRLLPSALGCLASAKINVGGNDVRGHGADTERHSLTNGWKLRLQRLNTVIQYRMTDDSVIAFPRTAGAPDPEPGSARPALETVMGAASPRGPGRQPGLPRVPGSGRKKGQANHVNRDIRELIITRGQPVEFLCDVVKGRKVRVGPQAGPGEPMFVYPSLGDRLKAAGILAAKVVPDMKSLEATGADGTPLIPSPVALATVADRRAAALSILDRLGTAGPLTGTLAASAAAIAAAELAAPAHDGEDAS